MPFMARQGTPEARRYAAAGAAPWADRSALVLMGGRITGDAIIYGAAGGVTVAFGLASVAILTRFLSPAEFGTFALLTFFASTLMVIYNLGSLQGTLGSVFGADEGDDPDTDGGVTSRPGSDRRRTLGTGLLLTIGIGAVGTAVVAACAEPLAGYLIDDGDATSLILAAVAGGLGAAWRLSANVSRLERRPFTYLYVHAARPALILMAAVPLVATGGGVHGAITGLAIGNGLGLLVALISIRRSFVVAFRPREVVAISRLGQRRVPLIMSFWLLQNLDIFLASRYLGAADVGLYRVSTRVGALTAYWTSSVHMAWGAMTRDVLQTAVDRELGRASASALVATYFTIGTLYVLLAIALFADVLVEIAAPEYADAADIIPLSALAFASHGWYVLAYRTSQFRKRRRWFIALAVLAVPVFIGSAALLIPALGVYGAPLAIVVAFGLATVVLLVRSRFAPDPTPYQWRRLLGALAVTGCCYAGAELLVDVIGIPRALAGAAGVVAFPVAVLALGVISPRELGALRNVASAVRRRWPRSLVQERLAALDSEDRRLLELVVRHHRESKNIAEIAGAPEDEVLVRFVHVLRDFAGAGTPTNEDLAVAHYVLWSSAFADRDVLHRRLTAQGVDPRDLHLLTMAFNSLRRSV